MLWQPGLADIQEFSIADIYAITAGLAFALMNMTLRKLGGDVAISLKIGAAAIGVIMLCLPGLLLLGLAMPAWTWSSLLLVALLGFPFMYIMTWTAQYGVTHIPIRRSSIIFLLEIVAGAVSAALLTNEVVSGREYLGGLLIIAAGLLTVVRENGNSSTPDSFPDQS